MTALQIYASLGIAWALFRFVKNAKMIAKGFEIDKTITCDKEIERLNETKKQIIDNDLSESKILSTFLVSLALIISSVWQGLIWPLSVISYISMRLPK